MASVDQSKKPLPVEDLQYRELISEDVDLLLLDVADPEARVPGALFLADPEVSATPLYYELAVVGGKKQLLRVLFADLPRAMEKARGANPDFFQAQKVVLALLQQLPSQEESAAPGSDASAD